MGFHRLNRMDFAEHSYYLYTVKAKRRDELIAYLKSIGIGASIEYPVVLHELPYIRSKLISSQVDLPNSENCLKEILALPMYSELQSSDQDSVIEEIKSFYQK